MALREILLIPDPVLKVRADPVDCVDDEVRALMDDMLETMYHAPGIGLAAVQIGITRRVIVLDIAAKQDEEPKPLVMANPEIIWSSSEIAEYEEGCLSIPEIYEMVSRPAQVKVRYLDRSNKQQELHCKDLLATCIQHEIDHLDGVLFIDYLSRLKRDRIIKKFSKAARQHKGAA